MLIAKLDNIGFAVLSRGLFNNGFSVLTRGARYPLVRGIKDIGMMKGHALFNSNTVSDVKFSESGQKQKRRKLS